MHWSRPCQARVGAPSSGCSRSNATAPLRLCLCSCCCNTANERTNERRTERTRRSHDQQRQQHQSEERVSPGGRRALSFPSTHYHHRLLLLLSALLQPVLCDCLETCVCVCVSVCKCVCAGVSGVYTVNQETPSSTSSRALLGACDCTPLFS